MDIHNKVWDEYLIKKMGLRVELFPKLYFSHEKVGEVTEIAALRTDYNKGTPVYAGVGDAGATTLASGISEHGEYNINLGTSGWVATISSDVLNITDGVFNLAAMPQDKYINVVPFLNAGNVHKWVSGIFTSFNKRAGGKIDYDSITELLKQSQPGCNGVMFLPYLVGERFPVMDINVKGSFVGLTPETKAEDMVRACLEGVAFSIRQGIEGIGQKPTKISVIGGGAREQVWCQIMADVLGEDTYVYKNSETLPSLAIASAVLLAKGMIADYSEFTKSLQDDKKCTIYHPIQANVELYSGIYSKYLRLYPTIKSFYKL